MKVDLLSLREKLKFLIAARCLMVTLLLGSALIVNINNVDSFDHPSYRGLSFVIISTYAVTMIFAVLLSRTKRLVALTYFNFAFDALTATILVLLTGRFDSPFTYLFVIVAMIGGVILERRGGVAAALMGSVGVATVLLFEQKLWTVSWVLPTTGFHSSPYFQAAILVLATSGVGILSGILTSRLRLAAVDLAESRRGMAALKTLHERIVNSLSSGLMTLDAAGEVTYANPASIEILRQNSDLVGMNFEDLGLCRPSPDFIGRWECDLSSEGEALRVLGLSAAPLHGPNGTVVGDIIMFQDLSSIRNVERQLAQRDRLVTVGRFAASIAHEIRNPLASISGAVEMLSAVQANEEDTALSNIVLTEITRLNTLVQAILSYAGPRNMVRQRFNLTDWVRDTALLFGNDDHYDIDHDLLLPSHAIIFVGDPDGIRQVLLNVWQNAAQACIGERCRIQTRVSQTQDMTHIVISDDGPGISAEHRASLFEPFYTTKPSGTGLGLATAYQIALENRGNLRLLDSQEAGYGGACFELVLPASASGQHQRLELS